MESKRERHLEHLLWEGKALHPVCPESLCLEERAPCTTVQKGCCIFGMRLPDWFPHAL